MEEKDNIIIHLINSEKIELSVSKENGNEEIDNILIEKGYTREDIQGIELLNIAEEIVGDE